MKKGTILISLMIALLFSCERKNEDIKQENGNVWFSGGLAFCAEQIHLDNGDTLIFNFEELIPYTSGDRVTVKYKEIGINEYCPPSIDCEIIEINKIE